jgi:cytoplasmic iron level regulating protein YaaA (DUF328/UPF0246 family)
MLILLSPAKNLDWANPPAGLARTAPRLTKQTAALAKAAKRLKAADLKRLMDLSDKLAELNVARFKAFDPKAEPDAGKQAVLAFNGDVYQGLNAKNLTSEDLAFAQTHLRILSGLYGLLRPLDAIQPYRLEMGTKLATAEGEDLYDFWGDAIAKLIAADLADHADKTILNLASDEYFSAVPLKALKAPVITPRFLDVKDGKARPVFMFVKRARGMMARFAIESRATRPEDLKDFDAGGYRFDAAASDSTSWTFTRPQPPPVGAAAQEA